VASVGSYVNESGAASIDRFQADAGSKASMCLTSICKVADRHGLIFMFLPGRRTAIDQAV